MVFYVHGFGLYLVIKSDKARGLGLESPILLKLLVYIYIIVLLRIEGMMVRNLDIHMLSIYTSKDCNIIM